MKKFIILFLFILLVLIKIGYSQQNRIAIQIDSSDKQLSFAKNEIKKAAEDKGYEVSFADSKIKDGMIIKIISDSASVIKTTGAEGLKIPQQFGWQCYSIRVKETGNQKIIYILSGDKTGAMYGGLDIAEAICLGTINYISDSDNKPYIERRGIKWNMPLDLRTPNYADNGDHYQENIPNIWELDFWQQLIDEMVRSRLNLITIHSMNPFPHLVKIPEFPEIALNDVHRTKVKLGPGSSSGSGHNLVTTEMLNNYEVVKKLTIDEKIEFWREVMEYSHNCGVEFIWFTWNIWTYGVEGKYNIDNSQDNENTIKYFRTAVREMVLTYPHLSGFGITAGENMERNSTYTKEEWLWRTYGLGVSDALKTMTGRQVRLIHRFHQADLLEIKNTFKDYPGPFDLSYKYSWAHMYSIPNPPYINSIIGDLSPELKTFLTVRNDDIYSFRWGNPTFARKFILSIPEPEKIAGYYVGGYWAKDFAERDDSSPRVLSIQKRWYEAMLWGRLGYNPDISDSLFLMTIESKFKGIPSQIMMNGWSAASMIFPWITRFAWGGNDFEWFPEACFRNPERYEEGFITVKDFLEREPQLGSNISNILRWAENFEQNTPDSLMSPLAVADTLSKYAKTALLNLTLLEQFRSSKNELSLTIGDIEAFASIGNYYAEKIRGACSLALYNFYGHKQDQEDAIQHLKKAKTYWEKYANIYDSQYKPALFSRIGFINIPELIEKTKEDIEIAIEWEPGNIKGYKEGKIRTP